MSTVSDAAALDTGDAGALLERQTEIMQLVADGAALPTVLGAVADALEQLMDGARCSILLCEPGVPVLRHGAAPSLPAQYSAAIDGIEIGPAAGSCGTAAYLGTEVIAEDVAVDPRWADFRALALPHGLRSCWSTPITGREGTVGTFAVYHDRAYRPGARDRALVRRLTHLASLAIDHHRLQGERRARQEAEFARRSAEAASRAKSAFVSALSHELRTPLQAITGFAELLGGLDLTPGQRYEALEHIQGATEHILSLVDDVLDLARVEAGALVITADEVDAARSVTTVLDLLRPLAEARDVVLRRGPGPGPDPGPDAGPQPSAHPVLVRGDARRLRQVLLNVVGNAIRYNVPGGTVRVDVAARSDGRVVVTVRDTGPGIAPDLMGRLFVPFDRLDAEAGPERGVGLGLVLSRSLTEAMSGELTVSSRVGRGTVVRVTLPGA